MDATLPPLTRLRGWARRWAVLALVSAPLGVGLAVLDHPVWGAVVGGVAVLAATLWTTCALSAWTLASTLGSLARGEALGAWTLRPATATRFHEDAARGRRHLAWGLAVGVLALGLAGAWAARQEAGPVHGAVAATLTLLATAAIGVGWPRVERVDPAAPEAAQVRVGADCGLVGGVILVWDGVGIRPTGAEVAPPADGTGPWRLRIHARQRMRSGEASTTIDLPVEWEDLARAEEVSRRLVVVFGRR